MKSVLLGAVTLLSISNFSFGQTKSEKIAELLGTYFEYGDFNGSVLVAEKGAIIYKKGFGSANMEWDIPNQPDTKFRLASITKQFTAMLIVQLVAENKLALHEPISTYLPEYPKKNGDQITLHHLLTHTSGTPSYTSYRSYRKMMRDPFRPEQIVDLFADSALQFTPGEKFEYSNSGYFLLGFIVEKTTGKTYEEVLQEKIFTPLNMNNSGYDNARPVIKNRASGYNKNGTSYTNANYIDMSVPFAAGAIYSTVEDLYLWDQALYTEKLLPKKYLDLLFEEHIPSGRSHYGYGWDIGSMLIGSTDLPVETIGHSGGINGFNTLITRIPADRSSIVLLSNTGGAPLREMTRAINGILYDKNYDFPKRSVAHSMLEVVETEGMAKGISYYEEVKDSSGFYLDENEMNFAGYSFLQIGNAKDAEAIFRLNIDAFPDAFNVYDSYGECLLVNGDTTQAIENYKKSVRLNPGNQNGLNVLEDLGVDTDDLFYKVSLEYLKLLEGEYLVSDRPKHKDWKIVLEEVDGELYGDDKGYRYKLLPVEEGKFVNPDDGASLVFDTKNENAITFVIFGKYEFKKIIE